jgi:hypothetical protein
MEENVLKLAHEASPYRDHPATLGAGSNSIAIFNDPVNAATDDSVRAPTSTGSRSPPVRVA